MIEKLIKAGIPVDEYQKIMGLMEDDFGSGDPVKDFEEAIKILNDEEQLPSWASHWANFYGLEYKMPEIEPMEPQFDV